MLPTLQPRGDVLLHEKASIMLQRVQVGGYSRFLLLSLRFAGHLLAPLCV
jgi:signal peptidase I